MAIKEILDTFLDEAVSPEVCDLLKKGIPVIIGGNRNYATGKSSLCSQLRESGCNAYEEWELEEGQTVDGKPTPKPDRENTLFLTIRLDKELSVKTTQKQNA